MNNILGADGLIWFMGVIEDRNDPLYLNRVRVRVYGSHTHDKQKISTPDLPWAEVMMPTTSASNSGIGNTTHGLVEGSTVMGFYRDGHEKQEPVVMGSFIGIPQSFYRIDETISADGTRSFSKVGRTTTDGFNDPRLSDATNYKGTPDGPNPAHIQRADGLTLDLKNSPRKDGLTAGVSYPKSEYIGNSDVNFLSQGDSTKYPVINLAKGEPNREYVQPKYPFNHVTESESGHVIEIDDTPDYERIHLYHRKGTRFEIDKDGNYVEKIVKDKYSVVAGNDFVTITGDVVVNITGNAHVNVTGTSNITSQDKITITGNNETEIISDTTITGKLHVTGEQTNKSTITATDSITGKGVVLDTHTHIISSGSSAGITRKPN